MKYYKVFGMATDENGKPEYAGMIIDADLPISIVSQLIKVDEDKIQEISQEEYDKDYGDIEDFEDEDDDYS